MGEAYYRRRLASYKVPVRLAIRSASEFPRTQTGKIHKPKLRQELKAHRASLQKMLSLPGDRGFESRSLQRRVCEPPVPLQG